MLIEKQTQLAGILAQINLFEQLAKRFQSELDALPKNRAELARSGRQRGEVDRQRAELEHALSQTQDGPNWNTGIAFPELELLAGKPGLRWLRVQKGRLEREIAELQDLEAKWAKGTRKFRYTGRPDKFRWPTDEDPHRRLEPGDVVELTKTRAMSLHDMFEAIEEVG